MGEYNQASIIALFENANKYLELEEQGQESKLLTRILNTSATVTVPQSSIPDSKTSNVKEKLLETISKVESDLNSSLEFESLDAIYNEISELNSQIDQLLNERFIVAEPQPAVDDEVSTRIILTKEQKNTSS